VELLLHYVTILQYLVANQLQTATHRQHRHNSPSQKDTPPHAWNRRIIRTSENGNFCTTAAAAATTAELHDGHIGTSMQ
jgi:hypothetical protein